jgi:hypothetical protein
VRHLADGGGGGANQYEINMTARKPGPP